MAYKYQELMAEYKIKLDNPILDPAFVTKVKDFEKRVPQLTDEEVITADQELCEMFTNLHELTEEDSEEIKKADKKAEIAEAKALMAEANTVEELNQLAGRFLHLQDVQILIERKIKKIEDQKQAEIEKEFVTNGLVEIQGASSDDLPALAEKYKDSPDLLKAVNERIEAESKQKNSLRDQLSKRREWDYGSLKAIGITPTGDDMEIEGVFLERQYMFKIYLIKRVDGKPV